jgi:hypothetical protein
MELESAYFGGKIEVLRIVEDESVNGDTTIEFNCNICSSQSQLNRRKNTRPWT